MRPRQLIRVLVIDDSAYSRRTITRILQASPLVEVVGSARNGEEALRKVLELEPDLVTLDLEMPRMDGFTFLRLLMHKRPTPVIVVSGRSCDDDAFKALDLGAADFIAKPSPQAALELSSIEDELIRKVHAIRDLRIDRVTDRMQAPPPIMRHRRLRLQVAHPVVVIGASTGGPSALMQVLGAFSVVPDCAFVIAQHMPSGFTRGFAERLDRLTPFSAREAAEGDEVERGRVLVAPGGRHLELVAEEGRIVTRVVDDDGSDKYTPSVDRLFRSAAKHYGASLLAVVLTGMGDDGRIGAQAVRANGGRVIAESQESAVIFGMPRQVIQAGAADFVLPLAELPAAILGRTPVAKDAAASTAEGV